MTKEEALRAAGEIAATARRLAAQLAGTDTPLSALCRRVEAEIRQLGGELAFPVQTSRNEVAAHFCPREGDATGCVPGDLLKIDLGVHVDGWVVDTAVSVAVGGEPRGVALVEAAEAALEAAVALAGPEVPIRHLSAAIEGAITARGFRPMRNLCGHHVGRYVVHSSPPVPNFDDGAADVLCPGAVFAIEPFATTGAGLASVRGHAEVFRLRDGLAPLADLPASLQDALSRRRGLPFSRRDLVAAAPALVDEALDLLLARGDVIAYPPLVEITGHPVAQAEHTLLVTTNGVVVLTA
jgi:methionyl aminopeptidase